MEITRKHIEGIQSNHFTNEGQELYDYSVTLVKNKYNQYNKETVAVEAVAKTAISFKFPPLNPTFEDYGGVWCSLLYKTAKNCFIDYMRKSERELINANDVKWEECDEMVSVPPIYPPENEKLDLVLLAIQTLDEVDKEIFTLFLEGKYYSEIAKTICQSEGYVRIRIHRAKKIIKKFVEKYN